jgi:phthalate 4,5-dioxygenase oxygenase subunit
MEDDQSLWTANVMLMPFHKIIASVPVGAHIWAPMDDENTMLYCVDFLPDRPLTDDDLARSTSWNGIHTETLSGSDHAVHNKGNDYLIDPASYRVRSSRYKLPTATPFTETAGKQVSLEAVVESL